MLSLSTRAGCRACPMTASISACTRAGGKEQGSAKVQEKKPLEQHGVVAVRVPQGPTWDTCYCSHLFSVSAGRFPIFMSLKKRVSHKAVRPKSKEKHSSFASCTLNFWMHGHIQQSPADGCGSGLSPSEQQVERTRHKVFLLKAAAAVVLHKKVH